LSDFADDITSTRADKQTDRQTDRRTDIVTVLYFFLFDGQRIKISHNILKYTQKSASFSYAIFKSRST